MTISYKWEKMEDKLFLFETFGTIFQNLGWIFTHSFIRKKDLRNVSCKNSWWRVLSGYFIYNYRRWGKMYTPCLFQVSLVRWTGSCLSTISSRNSKIGLFRLGSWTQELVVQYMTEMSKLIINESGLHLSLVTWTLSALLCDSFIRTEFLL